MQLPEEQFRRSVLRGLEHEARIAEAWRVKRQGGAAQAEAGESRPVPAQSPSVEAVESRTAWLKSLVSRGDGWLKSLKTGTPGYKQ